MFQKEGMSGAKEAREKGLQVQEKYGGQWGWSGVTMVEGDEARGDSGQAMERMEGRRGCLL